MEEKYNKRKGGEKGRGKGRKFVDPSIAGKKEKKIVIGEIY